MAKDDHGNRYLNVGISQTMFTAHTDTVHSDEGQQTVWVDDYAQQAFVFEDCLGADCTTGVWLMIEMIKRKVPGLYVFFMGEECGGMGSYHFAEKEKHLYEGIQRCISFDRKGFSSVITHQFGERCCSDTFALALAEGIGPIQLNGEPAINYETDDTGTFTDSANFVEYIPECTNLSVGYDNQHTSSETQCLLFAAELPDKMAAVDWENLPTVRDPKERTPHVSKISYGTSNSAAWNATRTDTRDPLDLTDYMSVRSFVYSYPEEAADLLHYYAERSRYYESLRNSKTGSGKS